MLGEAIASASYIDKAFGNGSYSSKNHLGMMLLGGLLGSALDSKPQSQYQFRYAIRLGTGNIIYQDTFSSEPFRHPVGVCIFLPTVSIAPEQHLCTQTVDSLRGAHIVSNVKSSERSSSQGVVPFVPEKSMPPGSRIGDSSEEFINCKVGALAPVKTSPEKCRIVNGVILND